MLFPEYKIEKYHKDMINISQRLTKLMLKQERESLTSLFSLVELQSTGRLELMSCRLTREELRATKLSYDGGCGLEVRISSSQDLRPGDKVSSLAQCGSLYICFNPLNHYLSQKLKLNGKISSQTPKCPLISSETVLFKRLIFQIVEVNSELLLQTDRAGWQSLRPGLRFPCHVVVIRNIASPASGEIGETSGLCDQHDDRLPR